MEYAIIIVCETVLPNILVVFACYHMREKQILSRATEIQKTKLGVTTHFSEIFWSQNNSKKLYRCVFKQGKSKSQYKRVS